MFETNARPISFLTCKNIYNVLNVISIAANINYKEGIYINYIKFKTHKYHIPLSKVRINITIDLSLEVSFRLLPSRVSGRAISGNLTSAIFLIRVEKSPNSNIHK